MTAWTQKVRYRFGDIDHAGIAYYPTLLHLFHCAFEDWWSDALGHPYPKLLDRDKLGFPAVHLDVEAQAVGRQRGHGACAWSATCPSWRAGAGRP